MLTPTHERRGHREHIDKKMITNVYTTGEGPKNAFRTQALGPTPVPPYPGEENGYTTARVPQRK
eukprot:753456-Amphidinium_carterae.1